MLFNSVHFLVFMPIVSILYFIIPQKIKPIWLLFVSYYFYMSWNVEYALLIAISTLTTFISGILIERSSNIPDEKKSVFYKKLFVVISLAINLGILFFFKYFNFTTQALSSLFLSFGISLNMPNFDILLPVGISFYTFQALGYTIDVYRKDVKAEKNIIYYALFVSFFPQLVAGPIERSRALLSQIKKPQKFEHVRVRDGFLLILYGLFQKLVLADRIAIAVDTVYNNFSAFAGFHIVIATILFAIQIYCDFGGYSNIAIGSAKILGINLMQNFRQPYFAVSLKDFWSRWHISLSSWLQDYVFEPLVWSRWTSRIPVIGKLFKKPPIYLSVIIVFLISGIWHGAAFTFIFWGLFHGVMRVIGDLSRKKRNKLYKKLKINTKAFSFKLGRQIVTFSIVCISYMLFRAQSLPAAITMFYNMVNVFNPWVFTDGSLFELGLSLGNLIVAFVAICIVFWVDVQREKQIALCSLLSKQNAVFRYIVYYAAILSIIIFGVYGPAYNAAQFIYFQF